MMSDIEWALAHELPSRDLVPMLRKLLRHAEHDSCAALFAKRKLAELIVQSEPWKAALLVKELLRRGADERLWALLGLAQTLLGNYRTAARAYRQAMAITPDFPICAHNLGHLLDVALDRPHDALEYLRRAHLALSDEAEIASSYAHALLRVGRTEEARTVLFSALDGDAEAVERVLETWQQRPLASATSSG
jgi:Flp pilus assembly protein TadD